MINDRTRYADLPLPHPDNLISEDVPRLRDSLIRIDAFAGRLAENKADGADLLAETEARIGGDQALGRILDEEALLRKAADDALLNALTEEEQQRSAAAAVLSEAITEERRERSVADDAIATLVEAARSAANSAKSAASSAQTAANAKLASATYTADKWGRPDAACVIGWDARIIKAKNVSSASKSGNAYTFTSPAIHTDSLIVAYCFLDDGHHCTMSRIHPLEEGRCTIVTYGATASVSATGLGLLVFNL